MINCNRIDAHFEQSENEKLLGNGLATHKTPTYQFHECGYRFRTRNKKTKTLNQMRKYHWSVSDLRMIGQNAGKSCTCFDAFNKYIFPYLFLSTSISILDFSIKNPQKALNFVAALRRYARCHHHIRWYISFSVRRTIVWTKYSHSNEKQTEREREWNEEKKIGSNTSVAARFPRGICFAMCFIRLSTWSFRARIRLSIRSAKS